MSTECLTNLFEQNRIHCDEIQDAIIASVVPNVMHSLEGAVIKCFKHPSNRD